jgi:hypothetical protein
MSGIDNDLHEVANTNFNANIEWGQDGAKPCGPSKLKDKKTLKRRARNKFAKQSRRKNRK